MSDAFAVMSLLLRTTREMEAMRKRTDVLADVRTDCVVSLRSSGFTLSDIGDAVGVSPQAVAKMARRKAER